MGHIASAMHIVEWLEIEKYFVQDYFNTAPVDPF